MQKICLKQNGAQKCGERVQIYLSEEAQQMAAEDVMNSMKRKKKKKQNEASSCRLCCYHCSETGDHSWHQSRRAMPS
jgi:hypothetical protein